MARSRTRDAERVSSSRAGPCNSLARAAQLGATALVCPDVNQSFLHTVCPLVQRSCTASRLRGVFKRKANCHPCACAEQVVYCMGSLGAHGSDYYLRHWLPPSEDSCCTGKAPPGQSVRSCRGWCMTTKPSLRAKSAAASHAR